MVQSRKKTQQEQLWFTFLRAWEWLSEQSNDWTKRSASEASSVELSNDWAVRGNERMDEWVNQYIHLDFWLFWTTVPRRLFLLTLEKKTRSKHGEDNLILIDGRKKFKNKWKGFFVYSYAFVFREWQCGQGGCVLSWSSFCFSIIYWRFSNVVTLSQLGKTWHHHMCVIITCSNHVLRFIITWH